MRTFLSLPRHHLIHNFALFACCLAQINTSRFDMFVPHKVSKQSDVVSLFQEILGKPVTERMGINDGFI